MDSTGVQFLSGVAGGVGTGLQQRQEQQRQDKVRQEDVAFRERQLDVQREQAQAERDNRITLQNLQSNLERTLTEMKIGSGEKLTMAELAARQSEGEANRTAEAENIGRRADAEIRVVGAQGKETRQTQAAGLNLDLEKMSAQADLELENARALLQERLDADKEMEMWRTEWETGDRARARNEAALNLKKREATFMANLQARVAKEQAKYGADLDIRKAVIFAAQDMYKAREMQHMDMMSTLFKLAAGTQSQMDPQALVDMYFQGDPTVTELGILADTVFMRGDSEDAAKLFAMVSDTKNSGLSGLLTSLRSVAQGILVTDGAPSQSREAEAQRRFGLSNLPGGAPKPEKGTREPATSIPPALVAKLPPAIKTQIAQASKTTLVRFEDGKGVPTDEARQIFETLRAAAPETPIFMNTQTGQIQEVPVEDIAKRLTGDKAYTQTGGGNPIAGRSDPKIAEAEIKEYMNIVYSLDFQDQTESIVDDAYRYLSRYSLALKTEEATKQSIRSSMGTVEGRNRVLAHAIAYDRHLRVNAASVDLRQGSPTLMLRTPSGPQAVSDRPGRRRPR